MATDSPSYEKLQEEGQNDNQNILPPQEKKLYAISVIIISISYIVILVSMGFNIKAYSDTSIFYLSNYLAHELLFIVLGLICIIYISYCIIKKKYFTDQYIFWSLMALSASGCIFFNGFYIADDCADYRAQGLGIYCYANICYIIASIFFVITTFFLIYYKELTANPVRAKSPEKFYKTLKFVSIGALVCVFFILGAQINLIAVTFAEYHELLSEYSHTYFFFLFAFIITIYGILRGHRKTINILVYTMLLAISFFFSSSMLFFCAYLIEECASNECGSYYIIVIFSLIYMTCMYANYTSKYIWGYKV